MAIENFQSWELPIMDQLQLEVAAVELSQSMDTSGVLAKHPDFVDEMPISQILETTTLDSNEYRSQVTMEQLDVAPTLPNATLPLSEAEVVVDQSKNEVGGSRPKKKMTQQQRMKNVIKNRVYRQKKRDQASMMKTQITELKEQNERQAAEICKMKKLLSSLSNKNTKLESELQQSQSMEKQWYENFDHLLNQRENCATCKAIPAFAKFDQKTGNVVITLL